MEESHPPSKGTTRLDAMLSHRLTANDLPTPTNRAPTKPHHVRRDCLTASRSMEVKASSSTTDATKEDDQDRTDLTVHQETLRDLPHRRPREPKECP